MVENEFPERRHSAEAEAEERDRVTEAAVEDRDRVTEAAPSELVAESEPEITEPETQEPEGAGTAEQAAELHDRWLRAVAELDNLRKRTARDVARQRLDERARVAAEWLPIVDNLELALKHADAGAEAVIEGVRAVRDQAVALLTRLGFPRNEDLGARFDPARHEAVSTVEDPEAEPGTVVAVVRPGYGDGPDQLRPASVVVSTKAED
ncbi:nucleotide exchange factor GrpE [Planotetraspora phitsanulokensis]|uniref:Protein GrpE n=1 Tax=Planotetraspora phitsanulokensis TaxID=575192 RepID=A0A8J3UAP9_9ACTN|nr:nucleotide exchange factor GrpE [Planotetraspora phitsanulokensis]GII35625.1 protein GrpE [Planotetraspora phitsanulokensis]